MRITKKPELLCSLLIERGEVQKYQLFSLGSFSVALLQLSPGAKIKKHRHTADGELYFFMKSKEVSICLIGEEHELENTSDEVLEVLSIKYPVN